MLMNPKPSPGDYALQALSWISSIQRLHSEPEDNNKIVMVSEWC